MQGAFDRLLLTWENLASPLDRLLIRMQEQSRLVREALEEIRETFDPRY